LSASDRAFTTELVYGVLRQRGWLDEVIRQCSHRRWAGISLTVRNILRLGVYQLLVLDRVSAYAVVDEAVKAAYRGGESSAAGFVNAVLRKISQEPPRMDFLPRKPAGDYLAWRYSHPKWLVKRWLNRWGRAQTEALCAANNRPPVLTLRVNTLKTDPDDAARILAAQGVTPRPDSRIAEALRIENGQRLASLDGYRRGLVEIEALASMLAVRLLDPQPGESVLDACAGRGVKTGHIAQLMQNKGRILALDNKPYKLGRLKENCRRLGVDTVRVAACDVSRPLGLEPILFDRILVDAPCSSLGVIGRYPECRWQRKASDIPRLAKEQRRILEQVVDYLRPGGVLVYSVCSFEAEENEGVIRPFLQANQELELDNPAPYLPAELQAHMQEDGCLRLLPHCWDGDGFFIARLKKKGR
jgi:16S rRNA (cytosine967-C5)-methyltransferase